MNTDYGSIFLRLFVKKSSITCNNFLRYRIEHSYNYFHLYRTVTISNQNMSGIKIEVIQGGPGFATLDKIIKGLDMVKVIHSLPGKDQFLNKEEKVNFIKRI